MHIDEAMRHSLTPRQFCDMRSATLPDGQRIIHAHNAAGLVLSFLPDRGLDIWQAQHRGQSLTWISAASPHRADYGQSWLALFNGGLLTTCGLSHVGPPEVDAISGEQRDIHGNFTRLSAQDVQISVDWDGAMLAGTLFEGRLFGAQWRVERRYHLAFDAPRLTLEDRITNMSDTPAPLMLLYHVNVGYPLVRDGVRLTTPYERVQPRDAAAEAGFVAWPDYSAAQAAYAEQVFFHQLRALDGGCEVLIGDEAFGLGLGWQADQMPYFTQWKNTRQGIYVSGIEPGNCIPEGQNAARAAGRLAMVEPGGVREFGLTFDVLDSADAIQTRRARIADQRRDGVPVAWGL